MDNHEFLRVISNSFKTFLSTGSRSNEKLKVLHGAIASDLESRLGGSSGYEVLSLGIGEGRECNIEGRYIDKKVDITILRKGIVTAGIGVKFVSKRVIVIEHYCRMKISKSCSCRVHFYLWN